MNSPRAADDGDSPLDQAEQIALLEDPGSYPEATSAIERQETHLSWVFLADRFVYKLKKAVRFEFVDFRTVDARYRACQAELVLNRRLTEGVYLDLVPIRRDSNGRLHLSGHGEVVDWLVKMRRLPADRMLDVLIRERQVDPADVDALAEKLTRFLGSAEHMSLSVEDYMRGCEHRIKANYQNLRPPALGLDARQIGRIHGAQLRILHLRPQWFATRLAEGRLVDGHGDLRPEHVCLEKPPQVFDCIEFRDDFRRVDPIDELGFLAMECEALGDAGTGQRIIEHVCRATGDRFPEALLSFYKSYRACVRAKVAVLRSAQRWQPHDRQHVNAYLALADRYLQGLLPPVLLVVMGISGSGKSTLAEPLALRLAAEWLQTDAVRRELFGPPEAGSALDQGRYSPENRERVYQQLLARSEDCLRDRLNVILDGTFESPKHVTHAIQIAERLGATFLLVECQCPSDVAFQRIARRQGDSGRLSDATPEILEHQLRKRQPAVSATAIDTVQPLEVQVVEVLRQLRFRCGGDGQKP